MKITLVTDNDEKKERKKTIHRCPSMKQAPCGRTAHGTMVTEWRKNKIKNNRKYRQRNADKEKDNCDRSQNVTVIVCLLEILNGKMENIRKSLCIVCIVCDVS